MADHVTRRTIVAWLGCCLALTMSARCGQSLPVNRVRLWAPIPEKLAQCKIQGSNLSKTDGYVDLFTLDSIPATLQWTEYHFANTNDYRFIRLYDAGDGFAYVAELEFYSDETRLYGVPFGRRGSYLNWGARYPLAFDGDLLTAYGGRTPGGCYVGIDRFGRTDQPPETPMYVSAVGYRGGVLVRWLFSEETESYEVRRRALDEESPPRVKRFWSSDSSVYWFDTNVLLGATYSYTVSAINRHGESLPSPEIAATPKPPVASPALRIMCLGDSVTYVDGFRSMLWNMMKSRGWNVDFVGTCREASDPTADPDHEGHPAWENDMLSGAGMPPPQVESDEPSGVAFWIPVTEPDIILLHAGTINASYDRDPVGTYDRLLETIFSLAPRVIVVAAKIIPSAHPGFQTFNQAIPALVAKHRQQGRFILMADHSQILKYPDDFVDETHPNPEGYRRMARVWLQALASLQEPPALPPPDVSPPGSTFFWPLLVRIGTQPANAYIYYTVDGSEPGPDAGYLYRSPLILSNRTTLCVRSSWFGLFSSPAARFSFEPVGAGDLNRGVVAGWDFNRRDAPQEDAFGSYVGELGPSPQLAYGPDATPALQLNGAEGSELILWHANLGMTLRGEASTASAWIHVRGDWEAPLTLLRTGTAWPIPWGLGLRQDGRWLFLGEPVLSSAAPSAEGWHLVSLVQEDYGRVRRLVIDGAEVGRTSGDAAKIEAPIRIGGAQAPGANVCVLIDTFRLYNRALSLDELAFAYRSMVSVMVPAWLPPPPSFPPSPAGGEFVWRFQSAPNELHVVESSADLRQWFPVLTNRSAFSGAVEFRPLWSQLPAQFFRVQRLQPTAVWP